jgi:hypothetical protein
MKNKRNKINERSLYSKVYPFYSLSELANLIGYTRQGAYDLLIKNFNIPYHLINSKYIFYISELQSSNISLYESIIHSIQLNKLCVQKKSHHRVKAFYSTQKLSKIIGLSGEATKKLLLGMSIPFKTSGKIHLYNLSDIKTYCPDLYNSILLSVDLNEILF